MKRYPFNPNTCIINKKIYKCISTMYQLNKFLQSNIYRNTDHIVSTWHSRKTAATNSINITL